jgi:hypothetical protein
MIKYTPGRGVVVVLHGLAYVNCLLPRSMDSCGRWEAHEAEVQPRSADFTVMWGEADDYICAIHMVIIIVISITLYIDDGLFYDVAM